MTGGTARNEPYRRSTKPEPKQAQGTILHTGQAGGVLGTVSLLHRCRSELKTLPDVSETLGTAVRTNSESLVGIVGKDADQDLSKGPTITSDFYANDHTHITQNRFSPRHDDVRWQMGSMTDGSNRTRRAIKTLLTFIFRPLYASYSIRAWRNWTKRSSLLTVMQHADNQLSLLWRRSWIPPFKRRLKSAVPGGAAPSYIAEANLAARYFAKHGDGQGSITKTFNAAVVHQLHEEGVWSLDEPVSTHSSTNSSPAEPAFTVTFMPLVTDPPSTCLDNGFSSSF